MFSDLFEIDRLTSVQAIDDALADFECCIDKYNFERALRELIEDKKVRFLPLLFSNIGALKGWIIETFPTDPHRYATSLQCELLLNLSEFFITSDALPVQQRDIDLSFRHRVIPKVPDLIKTLCSLDFVADSTSVDSGEPVKTSQKQRKKKQRAEVKSRALDERLFQDLELNLKTPQSKKDVDTAVVAILAQQKIFLEFYLDILQLEGVAERIKPSFIVVPSLVQTRPVDNAPEGGLVEELVSAPSAYPKVQPMKSALYFDSVTGFGAWTILINQNAESELRGRYKKDKVSFDIIVKKITELSNGHFSDDNQKRLAGPGTEVPIFEAKLTGDLRLIYQIDVISSGNQEQQAIKVLGINTHAQMDKRMWQSIGRHLERKGKEYKQRCAFRKCAPKSDGQTFIPESWPPLPESQLHEEGLPNLLAEDTHPAFSRFLMEKFVVLSQPVLNAMLADVETTFPHLVSSQERLIIEHPASCYVIGRSGTGKTTTLLFKMLLVERTYQLAPVDTPKPRQIFVTQSRVLAEKVEQYFVSLVKSLVTANQSPEELQATYGSAAPGDDDEGGDMIDRDDILDWSGDLPKKFSELQDKHFPLFTTFDTLCLMLEADMVGHEPAKQNRSPKVLTSKRSKPDSQRVTALTYRQFLRDYWPHFTQSLVKRLDPTLVFSEFLGIIQGSEETLKGDTVHYLSRLEYEAMSVRRHSTFAENRENLYTLFTSYLSKKREYGQIDGADRTHTILDFFSEKGIPGQKVDHLYVDEVQDNLLIDTLILRALCHDPNGLFWSGDTAQTISVGSSFRFDALKAFQWRLEEKRRQESSTRVSSAQPEIFQLAINYRSHSGIVNCAHSVIELITHFWKDSIDKLAPERGVVEGPKPVYFDGWDESSNGLESSLDSFVFGDFENRIEFGAEQCILVRDEAAKERLQAVIGENVGLIMTIYDSKGLEFNDVLLYNFFGDSSTEQWRIILSALNGKDTSTPDFDRNRLRYASVCSELKFLYVAITRARENVWIIESSEKGKGMPMKCYWESKELIRILTPGMDIPSLATTSAPEEWAKKGDILFHQKKYGHAKLCYEKARMCDRAAIANAYVLRTKADSIGKGSKTELQKRAELFRSAAEAFMACSKTASQKRRLDYLRLSGDCYKNANELFHAAEAYRSAKQFNDAVLCYREVSHFDEAIDILKQEPENVRPEVADDVTRLAKLFYFNQVQVLSPTTKDHEMKLRQVSNLFEDVDETLEYLEDRDLDVARVAVLIAHDRFDEAAQLHLQEGRVLDAIQLYLRDQESDKAARQARDCILQGLWQNLSFGVIPEHASSLTAEYLQLASKLNPAVRESHEEIGMFQAIASNSTSRLPVLAKRFYEEQNLPAALLCYDHYFTNFPEIRYTSLQELSSQLMMFSTYIQLLSDVLARPNPQDSARLSKLFGFQRISESQVLLPRGTLLNTKCSTGSATQDLMLSSQQFSEQFRFHLSARLCERIYAENEACRYAQAFSLCLSYSVSGKCPRAPCPNLHVHSPGPSFYNARVRLHFQQVLILQVLHVFDSEKRLSVQKRYWLIRLYESIFTPDHVMGTPSNLDLEQIPEAPKACRIIREWIRIGVYSLSFPPLDSTTQALSQLLRLTSLALLFDNNANHYFPRAPFVRMNPIPSYLSREGHRVTNDLVSALKGSGVHSLVMGVLGLSHIIEHSVPVDIGVFCDILDVVCKGLIIAHHAQSNRGLHNITLPRSWLLEQINTDTASRKNFIQLSSLVKPMAKLLEQVYTGIGAEYLLYDRKNLGRTPNISYIGARNVFLGRICRALCLVGYNMNIPGLREGILQVMNSLNKPDRTFSSQLRGYIYAQDWGNLASQVRRSKQSLMDEMVVIMHSSRVDFARPSSRPRRIVYDNLQDIPAILAGGRLPQHPSTRFPVLNPLAPAFIPSAAASHSVHVEHLDQQPNNETEAIADEAPEDDKNAEDHEERELANVVLGTTTEEPQIIEQTEDELRAIVRIQVAYRKHLARQRKSTNQHILTRDRFWQQCVRREPALPFGPYRLKMWGPLPHVWALLEFLYSRSQEEKSKTKKRMGLKMVLGPDELAKLDEALTRIISALKTVKSLQKSLTAISDLHKRRDGVKLAQLIVDLGTLIRQDLPFELPDEMYEEYRIGYKGIVQSRAPPRKPVRPELNTDDL